MPDERKKKYSKRNHEENKEDTTKEQTDKLHNGLKILAEIIAKDFYKKHRRF